MRRMRVFLASVGVAALLGIGLIAPAGAYWTANPGPDPERCAGWEIQGSPYFEKYGCEWVDEGEEEAPSGSGGGAGVSR